MTPINVNINTIYLERQCIDLFKNKSITKDIFYSIARQFYIEKFNAKKQFIIDKKNPEKKDQTINIPQKQHNFLKSISKFKKIPLGDLLHNFLILSFDCLKIKTQEELKNIFIDSQDKHKSKKERKDKKWWFFIYTSQLNLSPKESLVLGYIIKTAFSYSLHCRTLPGSIRAQIENMLKIKITDEEMKQIIGSLIEKKLIVPELDNKNIPGYKIICNLP